MNVVEAILTNNEDEFMKLIKTTDINFTNNGFTLLWIAINGVCSRPQTVKTEFANYNIVSSLLENGADPNKKCILMTPLYSAVYHNRPDIIRLLLLNGADANEFSLIRCFNKNTMLYEIPLNLAIREVNIEIVKLLLLYNVFYNKVTLEKILYGIHKINKETNNIENYQLYKKLRNILYLLKTNYDDSYEEKVKDIIDKSKRIGTYKNYYSCFEKLNLIQ